MKLYRDEKWLRQKYLIEKHDVRKIAELAGCGPTTIRRWMDEFNIPIRSLSEARKVVAGKRYANDCEEPLYGNKDWLEQRYRQDKMTMKEIATLIGCSTGIISRRLDEFGIKKRTLSEKSIMVWDERLEDLSGQKFNNLTILESAGTNKRHQRLWKCICDCGNITIKIATELRTGHVKSCGCLKHPNTMPKGEAAFNKLLYRYRKNAEARGYEFDLSREQFRNLVQESCCYCGAAPSQEFDGGGHGVFIYNGLDRLDSKEGYTVDNVVACCKQCNYAKQELSPRAFASWIAKVYNHWVIPLEKK